MKWGRYKIGSMSVDNGEGRTHSIEVARMVLCSALTACLVRTDVTPILCWDNNLLPCNRAAFPLPCVEMLLFESMLI